MTADALSRELRYGSGEFLARRRGVVGAGLTAMGSLGVVTLYQMGLIRHLPDPPLPGCAADTVHGAAEAYAHLAAPDAVVGLGSYAVTLALAAMGGADRPTTHPWIPLALAAKVVVDLVQAGRLTWIEVTKQHAVSLWSLLIVGATAATGPLVIPEAREAMCQLLS